MAITQVELVDCNGNTFCYNIADLNGKSTFIKVHGGTLIIKEIDHTTPPLDCEWAEGCYEVADAVMLLIMTKGNDHAVSSLCSHHKDLFVSGIKDGILPTAD